MKRHVMVVTLALLAGLAVVPKTQAITIFATSDIVAMNCCTVGTVHIYNGLTIINSSAMWANESFSHLWLATAGSCDQTYNHFLQTCCIGSSGNSRIVVTELHPTCPFQARGRSYGWIGGYGNFPYKEDQADSQCAQPCYCGWGGGGEDPFDPPCDPLEDPFCF